MVLDERRQRGVVARRSAGRSPCVPPRSPSRRWVARGARMWMTWVEDNDPAGRMSYRIFASRIILFRSRATARTHSIQWSRSAVSRKSARARFRPRQRCWS